MTAGVHLRTVSVDELDRRLAETAGAPLTYDHIGSTFDLDAPRRQVRTRRRFVNGPDAFEAAKEALRTWSQHAALGARLLPARPTIAEGTTLLVVLRVGPVTMVAPDRIVRVVDEEDTFGFAYGTLPGHPERGEESFLVRRCRDGTVEAVVAVDAVPAGPLRIVAPLVRLGQEVAVHRYLASMVAPGRY